ncbi:MAG: tetratricopeptide repeat protein [Oligoflexia bacterium]|nr:tetratricopeptide repeat protein [Oligoflexia bacterium]
MLPSPPRGTPALAIGGLLIVICLRGPPAWAEADQPAGLAALQVGDCATALAEIPSPDDDAQRLALARCLSRDGDTDRALRLLDAVSDPGLASYTGLVRGEALASAGRFEATLRALDGLALPGSAGERVALLRGHAQIELAQWTQARGTLNALLQGPLAQPNHQPSPGGADPGEVRWWLAQGAIRRSEPDKAIPVLRRLWSDNPASAWATQAASWLSEQGLPVDDTSTAAGRALVAARIRTLQSAHRYPEALALQDSLGTATSPGSEARLAFRAKDYPRAVAAFARLPSPTPAQRFDHAVAMTRTGDYDAAAVLYRGLVDAAPTSKQADQASYKLGYLAYDAGRLDDAIRLFAQHLHRYPSSRYTEDTLWLLGAWSSSSAWTKPPPRSTASCACTATARWHPTRRTGGPGSANRPGIRPVPSRAGERSSRGGPLAARPGWPASA